MEGNSIFEELNNITADKSWSFTFSCLKLLEASYIGILLLGLCMNVKFIRDRVKYRERYSLRLVSRNDEVKVSYFDNSGNSKDINEVRRRNSV
jgi:hypothetical protein